MTARRLLIWLLALWAIFAGITSTIPPVSVFHCLDAIAVAAAAITFASYLPGVIDSWRASENGGITPGHLIAIAVCANWLGFSVRLGRWYVTNDVPAHNTIDAWAYNVGLWITVCASALLVGAVAITPPCWSPSRILGTAGAFLLLVVVLLQVDFFLYP